MDVVQRTAKVAIIKPLNCDWDTAGRALRSVRKACIFAANWTVTSLLAQDRKAFTCGYFSPTGEFVLPTKGINRKTKKPKLNIPPLEEVKGENSDYNLLRKRIPHISSNMISTIQRDVRGQYTNHRFDSLINKEKPPTFRSFAIPIHNQRWSIKEEKIQHEDDTYSNYILTVALLSKEAEGFTDNNGKPLTQIKFALHTSKIRGFEKQAFRNLATGIDKKQQLKIHLNERKKKWIVLIPYEREVTGNDLVDGRVMEVFPYGTSCFLKCVYYASPMPWTEDIEYGSVQKYQKWYQNRRAALSSKYRQDTKHGDGPKVAAVGHGRKRAIKNKLPASVKYNNMTRTFNQQRAAHIARLAVIWRCSEVQMANLTKIGKEHLILGDWPYYDLQTCIRNACEAQGVKLVLLDDVVEQLQQEYADKTKKGAA